MPSAFRYRVAQRIAAVKLAVDLDAGNAAQLGAFRCCFGRRDHGCAVILGEVTAGNRHAADLGTPPRHTLPVQSAAVTVDVHRLHIEVLHLF